MTAKQSLRRFRTFFVYELLQNADDAEASSIEFILHKSYLIFIHNGKKKFTITDPDLGTNHPGEIGDISKAGGGLRTKSWTPFANTNQILIRLSIYCTDFEKYMT